MNDAFWMRRALRLAERGFTPPNPMVGCVLVRDGAIVGEGFHRMAGEPHAEAVALADAGASAAGATAYVTLEPCAHWGRTPPCADALIRARVARVVAATTDNDPRVSGAGLQRLRDAGIAVDTGVLEAEARRLNEAFFHFHSSGLPFVTVKAAATLDGKIATRSGDSKWVSGEVSRRYAHRLRAQAGAVLVGIGTVLADDPLLTARLKPPPPRQPLRIVLDSRLSIPPDSALVREAKANAETSPLLIAAAEAADTSAVQALSAPGVEIVRLPNSQGQVDLGALLRMLAERQVISLLVDGGGEVNAAFLEAGLADRLLLFLAPKVAGGRDARTVVEGNGVSLMSEAYPVHNLRVRRLGADLMVTGTLRPEPDAVW